MSVLTQEHDAFHAHLDICNRCRNQPFNLCATGAALLVSAAKSCLDKRADAPQVQEPTNGAPQK